MEIRCKMGFGGRSRRVMVGECVGGGMTATKGAQGVEVGDGVACGVIKINENFFSIFVPSADIFCVWLEGFFAVAAFVVAGGAMEAEVDKWTI